MDSLFFLRCIESAFAIMAMTMAIGNIHKPTGLRIVISIFIILASCLFLTGIYQNIGIDMAEKIYLPLIIVFIGGLIFFQSTDKFWVTFFIFLTQCIIYFGVSMGCATLTNSYFQLNEMVYLLMRAAVFTVIILLQIKYVRKSFRHIVQIIDSEWYLVSLFLVVFCVLIIALSIYPTMYYYRSIYEQIDLLLTYLLFFVALRCLYVGMNSITQKYELIQSELEMKEKVKYVEMYKRLSETDFLTGLLNRRAFEEQMKIGLTADKTGILLFMDINDFKQVNDIYGHSVGDEVLKLLAEVLCNSFRSTDIIARSGGDEFIVLVSNMQENDEKIEQKIEGFNHSLQQRIKEKQTIPFFSVSIGIAFINEQDDFRKIYKKADHAMYVAKNKGHYGNLFMGHEDDCLQSSE
ncbi:GGDEF domain-containing protein [Acetobacterium tundrae]|uniref:GGDEF domain-containing protein n=1 Tax=Acetobacterium tundrae TaxID=132932 RepID=UPI00164BD964|nr:GGDEF domain-containing protein [Acetobacterium tundrae]